MSTAITTVTARTGRAVSGVAAPMLTTLLAPWLIAFAVSVEPVDAHAAAPRVSTSRVINAPVRPAEPEPAQMTLQEAMQAARKAMQSGDLSRFDAVAAVIPKNSPLFEYLQYWRLRIRLNENNADLDVAGIDRDVAAFIAQRPDNISADLLRRDWMLSLGRRDEWNTFDAVYAQWVLKDENGPKCLQQASLHRKGATDLGAVRALLMQPIELHRACARLFAELADEGVLTAADLSSRFRHALEANSVSDIEDAAMRLPGLFDQAGARAAIETAIRRPSTTLASTESRSAVIAIAIARMARSDPQQAARWLQDAGNAARAGTTDERLFLWSQLAAAGARRLDADSVQWARNAAGAQASDETLVWLVRGALRAGDWSQVLATIDRLSATTRRESAWVYWRARALLAAGRTDEARAEFERNRHGGDLFGKLSLEELGVPVVTPPARHAPSDDQVNRFDDNAGFARAVAFYQVGLRFEGNREWNYQLRGRADEELRAAAHWAHRHGLLDRAINTDERLGADPDQSLRFPTPFLRELEPVARANSLPIEWVYGLIRQESRFIMDARSQVGASGLMQLMPATARWVARRLGRSSFDVDRITDLKTNLEFGTYYMKSVLDNVDGSMVLASAGYNAGPRRAQNWRALLDRPLEGAVFAEIIPFAETRGYVKSVLSNAVDYAALMTGKPQSTKAWLGTVQPRGGDTDLP